MQTYNLDLDFGSDLLLTKFNDDWQFNDVSIEKHENILSDIESKISLYDFITIEKIQTDNFFYFVWILYFFDGNVIGKIIIEYLYDNIIFKSNFICRQLDGERNFEISDLVKDIKSKILGIPKTRSFSKLPIYISNDIKNNYEEYIISNFNKSFGDKNNETKILIIDTLYNFIKNNEIKKSVSNHIYNTLMDLDINYLIEIDMKILGVIDIFKKQFTFYDFRENKIVIFFYYNHSELIEIKIAINMAKRLIG